MQRIIIVHDKPVSTGIIQVPLMHGIIKQFMMSELAGIIQIPLMQGIIK
jgi:hypothetical protein